MRFRFRKSLNFGPIRLNFTDHGYSSWSFHLGPFTWNSRGRKTINTPGLGYVDLSNRHR